MHIAIPHEGFIILRYQKILTCYSILKMHLEQLTGQFLIIS